MRVKSLHPERSKGNGARFICECDCGTAKVVLGSHLRRGKVVSCGCRKAEALSESRITHGMSGTGAWHSWRDMMKRCHSTKSEHYHDYGGRGITVCLDWHDFESFHAYMGDRPEGMSIERLDVNGNYEPGNCSWIPKIEQHYNKRNTIFVEIEGNKVCLSVACKQLGLSYNRTRDRIKTLGWSPEKALSEPKKINGELYA